MLGVHVDHGHIDAVDVVAFRPRKELVLETWPREHDVHRQACRIVDEWQHATLLDAGEVVEPRPKSL